MPKPIAGALTKLKGFVGGFTLVQKTFAIILAAAVVLGAVALGSHLMKPQMSPLFTGLSASDANAVVEQLNSAGVNYELTDGGTSILVPKDKVYEQRLAAASSGLPGDSSGGYSLLDEMGVTSSEFQQSVTYKRAIEGELARTIGAMSGINGASVKLAIPEESVFVSEQQNPTASVFVETGSGKTLSRDQIDAIAHLTSGAVTGMSPVDVSVVDQDGKVLSAAGIGTTGSASEQASEYEQKVAGNVQRMLDEVLGAGNATVSVAADFSRATSERVEESYEAVVDEDGNPIPLSEQETSETYTGGQQNTGVLGPDNIAVPEGEGGDGEYESTDATRNNAMNRLTERIDTPAGAIERQTVSVAVNSAVLADAGVAVGDLEGLVMTAAGIDDERGDAVTVTAVPFSTADADAAAAALAEAEEAAAAERAAQLWRTLAIAAAVFIPLIVLAILLGVRVRRRRKGDEETALVPLPAPAPIDDVSGEDDEETVVLTQVRDEIEDAGDKQPVSEPIEPEPVPAQIQLERERFTLEESVRRDPEKAAESLRTLMLEGAPR